MMQKINVSGLLLKGKKVLIVRRASNEDFLPGYYEIPGGKVEFGEHPHIALEREFKEEVNLKVKPEYVFTIYDYFSNRGKKHTIDIVFLVQLASPNQQIKLSPEHDAFRWIQKSELDKIKMTKEMKTIILKGFKAVQKSK